MRRLPFVFLLISIACGLLTQPVTGAAMDNPVVPNARLGEFRHGTLVKSGPDGLELAKSPDEATHTHVGVDLVADCGSPIYAFAEGKVRDVIDTEDDLDYKHLGYMVLIEHPDTLLGKPFYTLYLHMKNPPKVERGQPVEEDKSVIGEVGDTGAAQGCHTHFEIRYSRLRYFPGWCKPRCNIYGPGDQRDSEALKHNWEDPGQFFASSPSGLRSAESIPIHECDQFAADPWDEHAVTTGVPWKEIDAEQAMAACQAAVSEFPNVPRFRFQLGRALHKTKKYEEALRLYQNIADKGYIAALHYIGEAYQKGLARVSYLSSRWLKEPNKNRQL